MFSVFRIDRDFLHVKRGRAEIDRIQPAPVERGGEPHGFIGPEGTELFAKGCELGGGSEAVTEKLHFVENPERVVSEQAKIERPAGGAAGITAIKRAAEQDVLCADADGWAVRAQRAIAIVAAAHKFEDGKIIESGFCGAVAGNGANLAGEGPTGQAPEQVAGSTGALVNYAI
jgi:hypothetical protein